MAGIQTKWLSTPDKVNHNTKGYTSKVIFNYQSLDGIEIASGAQILFNIITTDLNYKGSNILPVNYFSDADGRTFRITMYFLQELNGDRIRIDCQMMNIDQEDNRNIAIPDFGFYSSNTGAITLIKYECEVSAFNAASGLAAQGFGNIIFSNSDNEGTNVVFIPISGPGTIFSGNAIEGYSIDLVNNSGSIITVKSLIIEEIS